MNQLATLSGKSYRTVKAALGDLEPHSRDGRTLYYAPAEALRRIYAAKPESERDRLDRVRADSIEHDLQRKRSEVAPVKVLTYALGDFAGQAKAIIDALPAKLKKAAPFLRARELKIIETELVRMGNALAGIQIDFDTDGED
jgi:phage terminase Nu1 subunit (DNA packaging protein)